MAIGSLPFVLIQIPVLRDGLLAGLDWLKAAGSLGPVVYVTGCAAAGLVAGPVALLSAFAGYAWGFPEGMLAAVPGTAAQALVTYELSRRFAGRGGPGTEAPAGAWEAVLRTAGDQGPRVALLLRMSPLVPQNYLSVVLGLAGLGRRDFLFATAVGMLPVIALYVYVGTLVRTAAELLAGPAIPRGPVAGPALVGGLAVSAVAVVVTASAARRELKRLSAGGVPRDGAHAPEPAGDVSPVPARRGP